MEQIGAPAPQPVRRTDASDPRPSTVTGTEPSTPPAFVRGGSSHGRLLVIVLSALAGFLLTVVFLLMTLMVGGRLGRWIAAEPRRASVMMAAAFITAGVFTVLYWDVRILVSRDLIWYPLAPWT